MVLLLSCYLPGYIPPGGGLLRRDGAGRRQPVGVYQLDGFLVDTVGGFDVADDIGLVYADLEGLAPYPLDGRFGCPQRVGDVGDGCLFGGQSVSHGLVDDDLLGVEKGEA